MSELTEETSRGFVKAVLDQDRRGLEDKLLKNHDVTIEYPMDEEDEIVFGVIGNYERDYMV